MLAILERDSRNRLKLPILSTWSFSLGSLKWARIPDTFEGIYPSENDGLEGNRAQFVTQGDRLFWG